MNEVKKKCITTESLQLIEKIKEIKSEMFRKEDSVVGRLRGKYKEKNLEVKKQARNDERHSIKILLISERAGQHSK